MKWINESCWRKRLHHIFTSTRTLESLCQELVEQGLLKKANNVRLQDMLGKYYLCRLVCHLLELFLLSYNYNFK